MQTSTRQRTDRLIESARQGSGSALNRLMASCRPELVRRADAGLPRSLARKLDPDDVVQECQFEAAARFREFRGRSAAEFRAWMGAMLEHKIIMHEKHWRWKKRDTEREEPLGATGDGPDVPADSTTSILERLARDERLDQLMVAAGWCDREDRELIFLRLWKDRSYQEIAADSNTSCGAVRQRFRRAVRRLGQAMRLQALMTRRGIAPREQDVIGIHQFQGVDATAIADRLKLPEWLVTRWLAGGRPLVRELDEEKP